MERVRFQGKPFREHLGLASPAGMFSLVLVDSLEKPSRDLVWGAGARGDPQELWEIPLWCRSCG